MAYEQPTLETLRASVSRDLHDLENNTFSTAEVTDMINMGLSELNRLVPKEYRGTVTLVDGQYEYDLDDGVNYVFSVEMWRETDSVLGFSRALPKFNGESNTGWQFFAGLLLLPTQWAWDTDYNDSLVVMGYQQRDPVLDDEDVVDVDLDGETVIRAFCAFTAFQRLIQSRALFQQWQTQGNNSDVSATQLLGMAATYSREWHDTRMRVRRLRRVG